MLPLQGPRVQSLVGKEKEREKLLVLFIQKRMIVCQSQLLIHRNFILFLWEHFFIGSKGLEICSLKLRGQEVKVP